MQVQIKEFTGPLDLLLKLIRREEMDILDIDIHKITHQYLSFIEQHSIPELDSAGQFISLAATLIYIKSKNLVATVTELSSEEQTPLEDTTIEEADPQKMLVQKLLRLQKIQHISKRLNHYALLGRDVWNRNTLVPQNNTYFLQNTNTISNHKAGLIHDNSLAESSSTENNSAENNKDSSSSHTSPSHYKESIKPQALLNLLKAYYHTTQKNLKNHILPSPQAQPFLSDCITTLHPHLSLGSVLSFSALAGIIGGRGFMQAIVLFLSLLELTRLGVVSLHQEKDFSNIMISVVKPVKDLDFRFMRAEASFTQKPVEPIAHIKQDRGGTHVST